MTYMLELIRYKKYIYIICTISLCEAVLECGILEEDNILNAIIMMLIGYIAQAPPKHWQYAPT